MNNFSRFIASGFGTGYLPKAPGTWGALGGFLIILPFYLSNFGNHDILLLSLIILFTALGVWSANMVESEWGHDPKKVVIDEMVGFWISVVLIKFSWFNFIVAFALFRLYDIFKPLGIRKAEKLKGGTGVMADDIVAGIYANVTLRLIIYFIQV